LTRRGLGICRIILSHRRNVANMNGSNHHDVEDGIVDAGIALFDSTANTITNNVAVRNTIGYFADAGSTGNSFTDNTMSGSLFFRC
jgi:parallel beta-helix repeat protein